MAWINQTLSLASSNAITYTSRLISTDTFCRTLNAFPLEDGFAEAVNSGAAVDGSGLSAVARCASAQVAAFAERGAAPSVVFELRCYCSWLPAGVPFLAVAAASGVPDFV